MPAGRPTDYTNELAQEICEAISLDTLSLKTLCENNPHWPTSGTIRAWIREKEEFSNMYLHAKEHQADLMAEEIIEIADYAKRDTIIKTNKNGDEYEALDYEWVARSKLRVDARKWAAARLRPKLYGDRVDINQNIETPFQKNANMLANDKSSDK